jgi:hypothetical protein
MGIEVDGANQKLILDSDGDTYIEGATDDTLKVYVSGAQDFTITANTLTAESGSTIAAQALTATTVTASGIVKTDDATEATSTTDGSLQTDGGLSVVKDAVLGDDLKLLSDSSVIHFGTNSEITLTHSHDAGLNLKHTATADDKPVVLTLQTGETDIAANDVIGAINFQAPDESTGTDAILVAAGIEAVSEGDFSSSSNATKLSFKTGASEAAAEKMSLSSAGLLTIADDLVIKDGGTIGVSSDADSITIASNGAVTFSQTPVFPDGSIAVADLDIDGATDIGAAIVDADLFIIDDGAGGTNRKTAASRLKTYIGGFDVSSITGATALGAEPATTDEFVLSDAGTLKRVDYSHIRSGMSLLAKAEFGSSTGSSNIDIQDFVTSSFKKYRIYMNFSDTSDNIDAHFRFLDGSNNTIDSGYYVYAFGHKNNGSSSSDEGWLDSNTDNPRLFDNIDAGDKMVATGEYTFFPKGQGNGHQNVLMGTYGFVQQADYLVQGSIYARCTNTTNAAGIRFFLSSGSWNKVDFEVYGLRV